MVKLVAILFWFNTRYW